MTAKSKADLVTELDTVLVSGTSAVATADVEVVLNNILDSVFTYGSLICNDGSTAQSLDTTAERITAWNANGTASGVTPDHTADDIDCVSVGVYHVSAFIRCVGVAAKTYKLSVAVNDVVDTTLFDEYTTAGTEEFTLHLNGIVSVATAGHDIAIYGESDDGAGVNLTISQANLVVKRVG